LINHPTTTTDLDALAPFNGDEGWGVNPVPIGWSFQPSTIFIFPHFFKLLPGYLYTYPSTSAFIHLAAISSSSSVSFLLWFLVSSPTV
jgi:hypothetical protein